MAGWRHIFLVTDIEGVAGVESWEQTQSGPRHEAAKALATDEVNSVIRALLGPPDIPGPTLLRISVWDGHGCGGLLPERLDRRVTFYRHDDARNFTGLLRESLRGEVPVDALGFVGQHAMEGSGGTLSHTYSSRRIRSYKLNGRPIGEFDLRALYAWALAKIPTVFFSGDNVACNEAQSLVPGILRVQVKESLSLTSARHLEPAHACTRLTDSAKQILERDLSDPSLRPSFFPEPPFEFRKHFKLKFGFVPRPPQTLRGDSLTAVLGKE
ncbi:MAG: M55 family metallopeptidase [Gallionella sp.]|nr:M55 family metallopeptidase [Gallionella sp.]